MRSRPALACAFAVFLVSGVWAAEGLKKAEPPAAPPALKPEELQQALAGFKGFLVGEVVSADGAAVVLRVKAVTLIEGNQAPNAGLLLGRETRLALATEKGEDGKERPIPWLAETAKRLPKLPNIAFGGMGDEDTEVTVTVNEDNPAAAGAAAVGTMIRMTAQKAVMGIHVGAAGGPDRPGAEPRPLPLATARVQWDAARGLVMDRVAPGSQPGHVWTAMPKFRITTQGDQAAPGVQLKIQPPAPQRKDSDF